MQRSVNVIRGWILSAASNAKGITEKSLRQPAGSITIFLDNWTASNSADFLKVTAHYLVTFESTFNTSQLIEYPQFAKRRDYA